MAAFVVPIAIALLYWTYIDDRYGFRVAVVSIALALLAMDAAASMIRVVPAEDRSVYWPTGFAFGFAGGFLAVRACVAIMGYYTRFMAPLPIDVALTMCADIAYVACGFGILLVSNTQLRHTAEKMAMFDPLTNLPNRRVLLDRLLEAEQRAVEAGRQIGVIYMDLDGFKLVNDTLGHEAGDELLRNISAAMTLKLGQGDCLARVGGDEFVILVEDVEGRAELTQLAHGLKAAVESQRIPGGAGTILTSCGFALFPDDGRTAHDVMREADAAMYHSKRERRGVGHATAH
jgi:diguanylate cyclase (GGDEF)-like protein